jgi:hypothetical protein
MFHLKGQAEVLNGWGRNYFSLFDNEVYIRYQDKQDPAVVTAGNPGHRYVVPKEGTGWVKSQKAAAYTETR